MPPPSYIYSGSHLQKFHRMDLESLLQFFFPGGSVFYLGITLEHHHERVLREIGHRTPETHKYLEYFVPSSIALLDSRISTLEV